MKALVYVDIEEENFIREQMNKVAQNEKINFAFSFTMYTKYNTCFAEIFL